MNRAQYIAEWWQCPRCRRWVNRANIHRHKHAQIPEFVFWLVPFQTYEGLWIEGLIEEDKYECS